MFSFTTDVSQPRTCTYKFRAFAVTTEGAWWRRGAEIRNTLYRTHIHRVLISHHKYCLSFPAAIPPLIWVAGWVEYINAISESVGSEHLRDKTIDLYINIRKRLNFDFTYNKYFKMLWHNSVYRFIGDLWYRWPGGKLEGYLRPQRPGSELLHKRSNSEHARPQSGQRPHRSH